MNHYNVIRQAVVKAYPQKSAEFHTAQSKAIYDRVKAERDDESKSNATEREIKVLREFATKQKAQSLLYFVKAGEAIVAKNAANLCKASVDVPAGSAEHTEQVSASTSKASCGDDDDVVLKDSGTNKTLNKIGNTARAQLEAEEILKEATKRVAELATVRGSEDADFKAAVKARNNALKSLKSKQDNAVRQRKFQQDRRRKLLEICDKDDLKKKKLRIQDSVGRPGANELQPGLLEAIVQISMRGASAHERRRADALNSCRTLDDLTEELKMLGFNLSRSGVYLRLIPRNWSTVEGRRHITTVNVKLKRAQNDEHHQHADAQFAKSTYDSLMELCSVMGPHDVACLSQDDKAKVPLGLPAANKQSTIVMNMEYRIKLPDHDFVIAAGHKLTPSVIAGLQIEPEKLSGAVSASGPTFIGIRSGKHDSSVAATHAADLRHLYQDIDEFRSILYRDDGTTKPVLVILVDGGPDENPRYKETIKFACANFVHLQLDALFISTQAPGRSAYNPVERRMAPLSRFLAGLILPHDAFGTHLNSRGQTVDETLEMENFRKAGQTLADVWGEAVIDGFPVIAQWRGGIQQPDEAYPDQKWFANHVRASQYFLQVVKCSNEECCAPMRSSLKTVLPCGFVPAPLAVVNSDGLSLATGGGSSCRFLSLFQRLSVQLIPDGWPDHMTVPYDKCCPTVTDVVANRTCSVCKMYFPSQTMVAQHKREIHPRIKFNEVPKTRPVRIAARRQRELMAIIISGKY